MNASVDPKFENFFKALTRLEEALSESGYLLSIDGTIQRFEFTFEMAWKAIKKFLFEEGIDTTTARDAIKKAYQYKLIDNEKAWLNILKDRNVSSHVYDETEAQAIYERVKNLYFPEFKKLETAFKK